MTPVQRKIVEWIINYESNHSEDDSGPVTADALRVCLAAADRCARAEADLARVTAERDEARVGERYALACKEAAESAQSALIRERDEAIEDRRQARDDAARAAALLAVRTIERDARPEISREDAALTSCSLVHRIGYAQAEWDACLRIENALRALAAKVEDAKVTP